MLKKILIFIWVLGFTYFSLPTPRPQIKVNGYRSLEPGDTWQQPNVLAAYYTNEPRETIINRAEKAFNHTFIAKLKIPIYTYTLIHPPEYAKQVIRDTHKSWHFRELIHWQRESLFISFWEPGLRNKSLNLAGRDYLIANNQKWQTKVIFYYLPSSWWWRQLIWLAEILSLSLIIKLIGQTSKLNYQIVKIIKQSIKS